MLRYNHGASVKYKKSSWVSVFKDGILTAILKASTDFFSMTLFGKEFQSLIVRAIKLCWRLFVLALTCMNFLGWNYLVPSVAF